MKKLFLRSETAIAVLVVIALAAIPVLGGMKLKAAYNKAFASFEKDGSAVDKYGNSLAADINQCAFAAKDVLVFAMPYVEEAPGPQLYEAADSALKALDSAQSMYERYGACKRVIAALKPVYELALAACDDSRHRDALETSYATILDRSAIISRGYESEYREVSEKADALVSGFPAKQLAKLYGIGN